MRGGLWTFAMEGRERFAGRGLSLSQGGRSGHLLSGRGGGVERA